MGAGAEGRLSFPSFITRVICPNKSHSGAAVGSAAGRRATRPGPHLPGAGIPGGLRKVLACLWCPLRLSLMCRIWKMRGSGCLVKCERGFGEWSHVQGKSPQGVPSPGRGSICRCWHLPPGQELRQVAEPTWLPHLREFMSPLRASVSHVKWIQEFCLFLPFSPSHFCDFTAQETSRGVS